MNEMKKYIKLVFVGSLMGCLFFYCSKPKQEEGKTPLARVHEKFLYLEDIAEMIPDNIPSQDSITKVKTFVDFWVKEQALTKTAEINLPEEQKDVARELEKYRMTLLIERYKRKFLAQNLDTVITPKQISEFYEAHQPDFKLSQPAIKATFIKILKTTPNLGLVRSLYRSNREKDKQELKDYCTEHAAVYEDFNNEWIYFKDLLIEIPTRIDNQQSYLKSNKYLETSDSVYYYLVNIHNYRLMGATSPLVFVEGNIQSMMLNQRKQQLIDNLQTNIYNNMLDNEEIIIFDNK
jgi:hypothetical protein